MNLQKLLQITHMAAETGESTDVINLPEETVAFLDLLWGKAKTYGENLLYGIIIAIVGWYVIKLICLLVKKILLKSKLDKSVTGFLYSFVNITLKCILVLIVATTLKVEVTSIVTLLGSAGLALGLALQGSLSNFAGGVLILVLKPFSVGDYIIDGSGNEGTVTAIDVIYTKVLTPDNRAIIIPNGKLADSTIINASKEEFRRIDINVSIEYEENLDRVKTILTGIGESCQYTLVDRGVTVFVNKFDASSIDMVLRIWVNASNFGSAKWELYETIKRTFDENKISIAFDRLDVNIVQK